MDKKVNKSTPGRSGTRGLVEVAVSNQESGSRPQLGHHLDQPRLGHQLDQPRLDQASTQGRPPGPQTTKPSGHLQAPTQPNPPGRSMKININQITGLVTSNQVMLLTKLQNIQAADEVKIETRLV